MRQNVDPSSVIASALKALGHPTRLRLLQDVAQGPLCVQELQRNSGQSQSNISQHLAVLRDRGLVVSERQGNMTCYHLADERIADLIALAMRVFGPGSTKKRQLLPVHNKRREAVP